MPTIKYQRSDGTSETVEVAEGTSIMRAALSGGVRGIIGECGGQAMCATCHVFVADNIDLPEVSEDEDAMLDCTVDDRQENSRLSCQLIAGRDFETIEVLIADHQV